ncbi:peptidase C65 Otubain-domain-containing protein [Neohortaea acidophila]|uniref:ubiquitinyl hydrolase 1 n=1 Tax=Neohortaea acidophila TaxID=245834 RepID=A0A6A6Q3T6_9PEZI|nr:peptidase C65 Otubain-domain-containing protein [Neohortaea acidophila]KAF2486057.1 peptidase C65 Otubain-domain-containing protein [Neohortaea acidophila]
MASYPQQDMSDEQLSEFQKLSNEYVPEVTGPLVGERQSSTAIVAEYASADPVFQAKTEALPQKYSHYRTVRGDGSCGWRAVAFGYFEALIHHGDPSRFLEEETRLRSSSNILNMAGFDPFIYEDFADAMFDLLRDVASAMQAGHAEQTLLAAFNDESNQASILTYLKTLTAAWMKTRPQDYAPWLLEQTVEEYCNASVMPTSAEIENVGLSALKDTFLSPAGITLEVLYLDRSEGSEVNMHRFSPVNHGGFDVGTVRLLYRPGHYDLLYKLQDLPHAAASVSTYLQIASQTHREPICAIGMPDFLTGFAGMSYVSPHQAWPGWQQQLAGGPFRPSAWEFEPDVLQATAQSPLQTAMFRK